MTPQLSLALLVTACVSLATLIDPRLRPAGAEDKGFLDRFLGEGRRLFSNHFFTRSDVYFHSGYYPSMFDQAGAAKGNQLAKDSTANEEHADEEHGDDDHEHSDACEHHKHTETCSHGGDEDGCEHGAGDFLGKPKDFMDGFRRHFIISKHTHLDDKGKDANREILPWLKLSAQLDPKKIEAYTVAAFWLRDMGRKPEAEQCLREGLRHNPNSYELLFELGRCYYERGDLDRSRNLWEVGTRRWLEQESAKPVEEQNRMVGSLLLNHLARLEVRSGRNDKAVQWLNLLKPFAANPAQIEKRIEDARAGKLADLQ